LRQVSVPLRLGVFVDNSWRSGACVGDTSSIIVGSSERALLGVTLRLTRQ